MKEFYKFINYPDTTMILIYVSQINERINYTFGFIFEHILGIPVQYTDSSVFFTQWEQAKISYSKHPVSDEIHFYASSLLFEQDIHPQNSDDILKDPFALSFYLLSCYEEYLPFNKDKHQRFSYQESGIKDKLDITSPWIDNFAFEIFEKINKHFPFLKKKDRKFNFINTIDVDHPWKYRNKSLFKNSGSFIKKIIRLQGKSACNQLKVLSGLQRDPYFIYPYIKSLNSPVTYFIPWGKGNQWDTNHNPENKNYQQLILNLNKSPEVTLGLHPTYLSNSEIEILKKEKSELEFLTGTKISKSRQHYIKLKLPETYLNLLHIGIREEHSMGFQDHIGFRAGTCTPFYWFNLKENKITQLKVFPFCVMDVTLKNYMHLSVEEAKISILELLNSVKKVNGTFISIFHNDSLSDHGEWKGWKSLYEELIINAVT